MQVSSNLKCPWCQYLFYAAFPPEAEIGKTISTACPKCSGTFVYIRNNNNEYVTTNSCELNGVRHNWKYKHVPGYDLYKQCRRCGKEVYKPAQIKLPGFEATQT